MINPTNPVIAEINVMQTLVGTQLHAGPMKLLAQPKVTLVPMCLFWKKNPRYGQGSNPSQPFPLWPQNPHKCTAESPFQEKESSLEVNYLFSAVLSFHRLRREITEQIMGRSSHFFEECHLTSRKAHTFCILVPVS